MTLRERLRTETRSAHDTVDIAFSTHDPAQFSGYVAFLSAHAKALRSLLLDEALPTRLRDGIGLRIKLIAQDLSRLRVRISDEPPLTARNHHPIAVEYILLGSNMGMRIVQKRWRHSPDPRVLSTAFFLSWTDRPKRWRGFCDHLSRMPANGADAEKIVNDCKSIFETYAFAARDVAQYPEEDQ